MWQRRFLFEVAQDALQLRLRPRRVPPNSNAYQMRSSALYLRSRVSQGRIDRASRHFIQEIIELAAQNRLSAVYSQVGNPGPIGP
jgi:hypothetical protein